MKNKRYYYFIFSIIMFSVCNLSAVDAAHDKQVAMEFVKLVQKRYYFIHRLERPIKTLFYLYEKLMSQQHEGLFYLLTYSNKIHKKIIIEPGTALQFRHDVVRKYVKKIEQTQSIDPIKELWDDFVAYKYVESDAFVQETLKAIM